MLLNRVEKALMNNPIRTGFHVIGERTLGRSFGWYVADRKRAT